MQNTRNSRDGGRRALAILVATATLLGTASCSDDGFGRVRNSPRLVVELDANANTGTLAAPLALQIGTPFTFRVVVRAIAQDGAQDASFSRYVRLSSKPGAIGPVGDAGRNVLLQNGESEPVDVAVTNAFGTTYIVADDLGFVPVEPLRDPPPSCSNGRDDDNDGASDFPVDEGCASPIDDSEEGGTYAQGVSRPIFMTLPRVADVRGLQCPPSGCAGNGRTPYAREQIQIDTGYREDGSFAFDTVVTRISSAGFYVSDLGDPREVAEIRGAFGSIFAFNFNAPPRMRVCDRMKTYGGTPTEFFGFTQVSYPTWTLEEWEPARRRCLVPEPTSLTQFVASDPIKLQALSGSLVRAQTTPDAAQQAYVTPKFGPGDVPCRAGGTVAVIPDRTKCDKDPLTGLYMYVPGPDASNCDFDKNGTITFEQGHPENDCASVCTNDAECTEWSNFAARQTFRITLRDSTGRMKAVQADATASADFDPLEYKEYDFVNARPLKPIRSFTGTLHFFSGGAQYTIEVRCKDDIVVDLAAGPFGTDKPCVDDSQCVPELGYPPNFKCMDLRDPGAGKACRRPDPNKPAVLDPPPQACISPRTFSENNPQ